MSVPSIKILRPNELVQMPWKNGNGTTTEITKGGRGNTSQDWDWRISMAEVNSDGAFSVFPGIDRSISVIQGAGMDLHFADGRTLGLGLNDVGKFVGDVPAEGRLRNGPVKDFNLMFDRELVDADLKIITNPKSIELSQIPSTTHIVHFLEGEGKIEIPGRRGASIGTGETLIVANGDRAYITCGLLTRCAVVGLANKLDK